MYCLEVARKRKQQTALKIVSTAPLISNHDQFSDLTDPYVQQGIPDIPVAAGNILNQFSNLAQHPDPEVRDNVKKIQSIIQQDIVAQEKNLVDNLSNVLDTVKNNEELSDQSQQQGQTGDNTSSNVPQQSNQVSQIKDELNNKVTEDAQNVIEELQSISDDNVKTALDVLIASNKSCCIVKTVMFFTLYMYAYFFNYNEVFQSGTNQEKYNKFMKFVDRALKDVKVNYKMFIDQYFNEQTKADILKILNDLDNSVKTVDKIAVGTIQAIRFIDKVGDIVTKLPDVISAALEQTINIQVTSIEVGAMSLFIEFFNQVSSSVSNQIARDMKIEWLHLMRYMFIRFFNNTQSANSSLRVLNMFLQKINLPISLLSAVDLNALITDNAVIQNADAFISEPLQPIRELMKIQLDNNAQLTNSKAINITINNINNISDEIVEYISNNITELTQSEQQAAFIEFLMQTIKKHDINTFNLLNAELNSGLTFANSLKDFVENGIFKMFDYLSKFDLAGFLALLGGYQPKFAFITDTQILSLLLYFQLLLAMIISKMYYRIYGEEIYLKQAERFLKDIQKKNNVSLYNEISTSNPDYYIQQAVYYTSLKKSAKPNCDPLFSSILELLTVLDVGVWFEIVMEIMLNVVKMLSFNIFNQIRSIDLSELSIDYNLNVPKSVISISHIVAQARSVIESIYSYAKKPYVSNFVDQINTCLNKKSITSTDFTEEDLKKIESLPEFLKNPTVQILNLFDQFYKLISGEQKK